MENEKTNIDHLRDILKELEYVDSEKGAEAIEFFKGGKNRERP